jgi:hypothetical protein
VLKSSSLWAYAGITLERLTRSDELADGRKRRKNVNASIPFLLAAQYAVIRYGRGRALGSLRVFIERNRSMSTEFGRDLADTFRMASYSLGN